MFSSFFSHLMKKYLNAKLNVDDFGSLIAFLCDVELDNIFEFAWSNETPSETLCSNESASELACSDKTSSELACSNEIPFASSLLFYEFLCCWETVGLLLFFNIVAIYWMKKSEVIHQPKPKLIDMMPEKYNQTKLISGLMWTI